MPEPLPPDPRASDRSAADRSADHAAIDRLAADLLPALIAKLGVTGLGELEVREGPWRVRLRRSEPRASGPAGTGAAAASRERRPADRPSGERGLGDRAERHVERPGRGLHHHEPPASPESRTVATSPAVGIYRPRMDLAVGDRVRSGDRLGAVDMLGVAQEVLAPVDGKVGASLAEPGDAVEYGQDLILIEPAAAPVAVMPVPAPAGTAG